MDTHKVNYLCTNKIRVDREPWRRRAVLCMQGITTTLR